MSEEEEEQEEVENSSASEYEDASDSESDGNDEDSEFMDFLSKLRGSTEIKAILNSDGHCSIPRIVEDYEAVVGITAITDTRKEGPSSLHTLPFINSLREVSSQLQTFQASPETPDGTACGSALNAARQILYWSSVFISMMEASNTGQPTCTVSLSTSTSSTLSTPTSSTSVLASPTSSASTSSASSSSASISSASPSSASTSSTLASSMQPLSSFNQQSSRSVVNPQPSTSDTLPFGQHSLSFPPVFSATGCTASPFFHAQLSSSTPLLPSTLSGQPATLPPQAPSISSLPVEVTPSPLQQVSSSLSLSHPSCSQPSSSQSSVHNYSISSIFCPVISSTASTALQTFHQNSPAPALQLSSPSVSSVLYHQVPPACSSVVLDSVTLNIHAKYGLPGQSCLDWLNSLTIPRNVESLEQVKEIWELGSQHCPPLRDWTVLMRNFKSSKGRNTSIYSQRKFIYLLFQRHGFDVSSISSQYNEVKPGKLYKLLNTSKQN
ncbi:unnamed protein product [Pocillopora meandrina]|uniref:Uncharacterized protein n=1 Tax=Pocillopora meandrina TaxID=46732 RepID=A0AAU9W3X6_9CNID|nr:unnamed protein product [Pocillopora meandrina]